MPGHWDVLVASSDMEERRSLVRVCEGMSMNVISCNGLSQVEEVLSRQAVGIVFCDENLSDGSYRDLLTAKRDRKNGPRIVVTSRTWDWEEYLEAMRLGAFDVVRRPWHPTDVEMVVLSAMREDLQDRERLIA
jgi:DNA-binding NtrC family response regulator